MSQEEEDAPLLGDTLADLVDLGKITDLEALHYFTGEDNDAIRKKVREAMEETYGE